MQTIRSALLILGIGLMFVACNRSGPDQGFPAGTLYQHDFEENTGEWIVESDLDAAATYENGQLVLRVDSPNRVAWVSLAEQSFGDFVIETDARQISGPDDNSYGVLFRMRGPTEFYRFDISGDGHYGFLRRNNDDANPWTTITDWTRSPAIQQGANGNRLKILAQGSRFTFYINDQLVGEASDTAFRSGGIGLDAGSFQEGGVEIGFDNVVISEP
jgi:hypothetical protein